MDPSSMEATIIGVNYDGGIVLAADSRTKITELCDNVYFCCSADTSQVVSDYMRDMVHQHTIEQGHPVSVKVAASLVRSLYLPYRNKIDMIIGGWDEYEGAKIYGGVGDLGEESQQRFVIGGGGFAGACNYDLYGFLCREWKDGMNEEEAQQFAVKAIGIGAANTGGRPPGGVGVVRTVTINSEGVTHNFHPLLHEEFEPVDSLFDILPSRLSRTRVGWVV